MVALAFDVGECTGGHEWARLVMNADGHGWGTGGGRGWAQMGDRWWTRMDSSAGAGDYRVEWKEKKKKQLT